MKANALMMRRIIGEAGRNGLTSGQPKVLEFLSTAGEAAMEIFRRGRPCSSLRTVGTGTGYIEKALSKIASSLTADMKKDR